MANMCDNTLDFTCKVIPTWMKVDPETSHGISIEFEPRFLFLYNNFENIMDPINNMHFIEEDGSHTFRFWFETKWAPPTDLYQQMLEDDNITMLSAYWYEPGCGCLGYANNEEWIIDDDAPDRNYSDILDLDILQEEPPESYIELNGTDSWVTFDKYKELIHKHVATFPEDTTISQEELKEMTDYFE